MRAIADGLAIFLKYGGVDMAAEHDIVYAGQGEERISKDDIKILGSLGWYRDTDGCECGTGEDDVTHTDDCDNDRWYHLT